MTRLEELREELRVLDAQEEGLHQRRAATMRAFVQAAGGLGEAALLLGVHPTTVVHLQRLDGIAMVIYRNEVTSVDHVSGRLFGETGGGHDVQRDADSGYWRVAKARQSQIRLLVVVVTGQVRRIWPVLPEREWVQQPDGSGRVAIPLGECPLSPSEVLELHPGLGIAEGDVRPMRQGLLREYVPLDGTRG